MKEIFSIEELRENEVYLGYHKKLQSIGTYRHLSFFIFNTKEEELENKLSYIVEYDHNNWMYITKTPYSVGRCVDKFFKNGHIFELSDSEVVLHLYIGTL